MTQEEIYTAWANPKSAWSQWVAPVLFTQSDCGPASASPLFVPSVPWSAGIDQNTAVILDLPGVESIKVAVALTRFGFVPVPVFNASPLPDYSVELSIAGGTTTPVSIDMRRIVEAICWATPTIQAFSPSTSSPPAFMLDCDRLRPGIPVEVGVFDNRWIVFPQDFPSADYLRSRGIARVLLVQEGDHEPQNDLAHVLLRWQEKGIAINAVCTEGSVSPTRITVQRPSTYKTSWYRALAMLGLRRNAAGGFGSYIPESSAAG